MPNPLYPVPPPARRRAPRPRASIESFGPELLQTLLLGSRKEFRLRTTYREAVVFRQRLHSLRAAMRAAKHELAPIVERARIEIAFGKSGGLPDVEERVSSRNVRYPRDPSVPAILTVRPHDSQFRDQLLAAGIQAHELKDDPLAAPRGSGSDIDNILNDYIGGGQK